jgi:NADH-quinone oxidoreductase subunit J
MAEALLFVVLGLAAIAGALTVVLAKNPVRSALGLLGTLFSVAVLYVLQLAHFVAAVQVIVYAGAVLTLFLFVIMLIGIDKDDMRDEPLPLQRPVVATIGGVIVLLGAFLGFFTDFEWIPAASDGVIEETTNGTIEALADPLFTDWVLAFEATALLLTIAAAGAIALAHYRRQAR